MAKPPTNIAASVRARLLNLARQTNQPFDVLLTRFVHERLLYRLSRSPHADRFVLKGAMLLTTWLPETARGTRDLDLLGFGDASEQRILRIFREVLAIAADDGVAFDLDALQVGLIREELSNMAAFVCVVQPCSLARASRSSSTSASGIPWNRVSRRSTILR